MTQNHGNWVKTSLKRRFLKYNGQKFKYIQPWDNKEVELTYNAGKCAICTSDNKTSLVPGRSPNSKDTYSSDVFDLLNDSKSGFDAVTVFQIGVVGINIINLGTVCIFPSFS